MGMGFSEERVWNMKKSEAAIWLFERYKQNYQEWLAGEKSKSKK